MEVNRKAVWLFLAVSFFWGIPYALIRLALEGFEPATIVFVRVVIGACSPREHEATFMAPQPEEAKPL